MRRGGLRAVAAGALSNFRVFPDSDVRKAAIGRRIGVHVVENNDVAMRLPCEDVMKKYADLGVTIVDWSQEVGRASE